jgi:alkanesulfonate monooxygenase SsuD/methylene tetrahydromethanopterin reductase-like flavin-dependent oxidoreductase (luciferase family)
MCWSSGMVSRPTRLASCPSRWLSLVCKIPILLLGLSETNTIGYYDLPPKVPYRGYELAELTLVPRPRHLPVECWQPIVSASQRALDFMAKHGIKGIIGGGAAAGGANERVVMAWRETLARLGRETELGGDLIVSYSVHLAATEHKAIAEVRQSFEENMKMFGPLEPV